MHDDAQYLSDLAMEKIFSVMTRVSSEGDRLVIHLQLSHAPVRSVVLARNTEQWEFDTLWEEGCQNPKVESEINHETGEVVIKIEELTAADEIRYRYDHGK